MIIAKLTDYKDYENLHPLFKPLFEYLTTTDFSNMSPGRITLKGDDLYINLAEPTLVSKEEQKLEIHRKYIDLHLPLTHAEEFGWRPTSTLNLDDSKFDEEGDFALYAAESHKWFTLCPGEFCIVFPADAHAPIVGEGKTRKLIAKIKVDYKE